MESTTDSEMDLGSSSSGTDQVPVPRTVAKLEGPPYRKRPKNQALNDPTLEQSMGSKERALDFEEFPEDSPPNLDGEDQQHWIRIRGALFDQEKVNQAVKNTNPRSFGSHLAHARQTLRMLQDVSGGTRAKFGIVGCVPKKTTKESKKTKVTKAKNGIAKAKRAKSSKARDNRPAQHDPTLAGPSSSAAAQDDGTDAMEDVQADSVLDSAEDVVFETPEERAGADEIMRQMAADIREEHPGLRDITPDTMTRIAHLVDMGVW